MKIEVIANGKGSVTIKSEGDYDKNELLAMARAAARITTKMLKDAGTLERKPFGFEAATHLADSSLSDDREDSIEA